MASEHVDDSKNKAGAIMTRLKAETGETHSKLESLPYFQALIAHQLPLESYVSQLRALAVIHGVLEDEIARSEDKRIAAVWDDDLRKLSLLEADIAFFEPRVLSGAAAAPTEAALGMTEKIRLRGIEQPFTLLGYLYVSEGSTLGNSMHHPDISANFHLNTFEGCHYYASYQHWVYPHWHEFSEKMNQALDDLSLHDPVIEAAHEAFSGLEILYKALYPLDKSDQPFHATQINPEAGNHPMPDDAREIQAALNVSDRGWVEFPYYEHRYGRRGKRFSDSDTCWLVTLTALDQNTIQKQVDWICRVLATRGMPSLMMEQTLRFLHEELSTAIPEKAESYQKLCAAADTLRKRREHYISKKAFHSLSAEFEQAVGAEMAGEWKNTGQLLMGAAADEKDGISGTVAAIQKWLTDPDRFSDQWILAVNDTIQKALEEIS